jgi:hypothetical protein
MPIKIDGLQVKDGKRKQYDALTFMEYLPLALKTESCDMDAIGNRFKDDQVIRLLHASMGMTTEAVELGVAIHRLDVMTNEENIVNFCEEIGDVFWYVALFIDSWRIKFNVGGPIRFDSITGVSVVRGEEVAGPVDSLFRIVGGITDTLKRHIFYGETLSREILFNYACDGFSALMSIIDKYCTITDKRYGVLLYDNIEKLKKRFGDKFDEKLALNRNTKKELDHM